MNRAHIHTTDIVMPPHTEDLNVTKPVEGGPAAPLANSLSKGGADGVQRKDSATQLTAEQLTREQPKGCHYISNLLITFVII